MTTATLELPPTVGNQHLLNDNLRALSVCQSELAELLAGVDVSHATSCVGRDGAPTFRMPTDDGHTVWLGRCSTPKVRAEALVENFGNLGDNIVAPAVGNGYEIRELLNRLPRHAAIFVIDRNLQHIALALTLHDFSDDLNNGRLVFLASDVPADDLANWFEQFPGYEYPQRMIKMTGLDDGAFDKARIVIEQSASRIATIQNELLQACRNRLAEKHYNTIDRIAIISLDPRNNARDMTDALARSAGAMNKNTTTCIPSTPDRCHALKRLSATSEADATVIINAGWGSLLPWIPDSYPSASWLLPDACLLPGKTDGFTSDHRIFASTPELRDQVIASGTAAEQVMILEPGCDEAVWDHITSDDSPTMDIAIVGDLADLSASACGITYSSHIQLWDVIREVATENSNLSPTEVLQEAESLCDIRLNDEQIRNHILNAIRDRLIPTLAKRSVTKALADAGFKVNVFGLTWSSHESNNLIARDAPINRQAWRDIFSRSTLVVWPTLSATDIQLCLEAFARSAIVAFPEQSYDRHSQISEVMQLASSYKHSNDLIAIAKRFVGDRDARIDVVQSAQMLIRDQHLIRHRLATILNALNQ